MGFPIGTGIPWELAPNGARPVRRLAPALALRLQAAPGPWSRGPGTPRLARQAYEFSVVDRNKKLCYRRRTARRDVSVKILPTAA